MATITKIEVLYLRHKAARLASKVGLPPGSLKHVGKVYGDKIQIRYTGYDAEAAESRKVERLEELQGLKALHTVCWIEVSGIDDVAAVEQIGRQFSIHPLALEDVLNTMQRPKFEEFDDYLFIVIRVPFTEESAADGENGLHDVVFEQISILFGKDWVLSFSESQRDLFAPVRDRIQSGKGRIRGQGADYLTYALLDLIVDHFFSVLEDIGEAIEFFDEELVHEPGPVLLRQIHLFKRQLLYLHKAVWPVREVIGTFERCGSRICNSGTVPYLRDVYDHIIQVIDTVETYRDLVSGMLDIYLSSISYRLNEVMKVLTIISTLFIPLTFIAGVYGMNFEYMPELKWEYGYYGVWFVMLVIVCGMLRYFRQRKWL